MQYCVSYLYKLTYNLIFTTHTTQVASLVVPIKVRELFNSIQITEVVYRTYKIESDMGDCCWSSGA